MGQYYSAEWIKNKCFEQKIFGIISKIPFSQLFSAQNAHFLTEYSPWEQRAEGSKVKLDQVTLSRLDEIVKRMINSWAGSDSGIRESCKLSIETSIKKSWLCPQWRWSQTWQIYQDWLRVSDKYIRIYLFLASYWSRVYDKYIRVIY